MSKDIWVTDFANCGNFSKDGYGDFMARYGLAVATFGKDRVAIIKNPMEGYEEVADTSAQLKF